MGFFDNDYSSDFNPRLGVLQDMLANQYGLNVGLGSGTRSFAQQNGLYAQGRSRPGSIVTGAPAGSSYHNYGAAADLVPQNMSASQAGPIIGRAIRENPDLGLGWGGTFSNLYDPMHVQLGMPMAEMRQGARVPSTGSPGGLLDYSRADEPTGPSPQGQQLAVGPPSAGEPPGAQASSYAPGGPGRAQGGLLGGYPGGGGGLLGGGSLTSALMNPVTQFGLALASGRTPQEGIGAAGKAAMVAGEYEKQQQGQAALYQSLVSQGMDPRQATAIASNPATARLFMPELKTTKDALGQESVQAVSPWTGQPITQAGQQQGPGSTPGSKFSVLAPGVNQYDPNLPADEFKSQFGPEVQAAMDAYIKGDVLPSGNPRQNSINTFAKTMAQTYGQKAGIDVSDTTYAAKRKFVTEANSAMPNSYGGQRNAGNTALEHQHTIAEKIQDLDNADWDAVPQGAAAINWLRQKGSTAQAAKANALNDAVERYVDEVKKFYSGSSTGGVHEREAARQRFSSIKTPTELYAALKVEQELMGGKLNQLDAQAASILGPDYAKDKRVGAVIRPSTRDAIEKTNEIMDDHARGVKSKSKGKDDEPKDKDRESKASESKSEPKFDHAAAKAAGYTDAEIDAFLKKRKQ